MADNGKIVHFILKQHGGKSQICIILRTERQQHWTPIRALNLTLNVLLGGKTEWIDRV